MTVNKSAYIYGREIGRLNTILKRGMDIIGSILGLLITLLLGPFIGFAIKVATPGPILFRQERIGMAGRPFRIIKFRTMYLDAEQELETLLDINNLVEPVYKLKDDPRITPVGRFLRRWSLDELPQFWNVLIGDMSLVGPRPEERRIADLYDDRHRKRLAVKPGMTGPMQVKGRGDLPMDARVSLELAYIENYSIGLDMVLLIKTVPAVLEGRGAR